MEQVTNANEAVIAVCKSKKNDKDPVVFYADRFVMKGQTIPYADVDTISVYAYSTKYSFLCENFTSWIKMKLRNGQKLKWKSAGMSMFGLGSLKLKKEFYSDMYEACSVTVINARAAEYIGQIRNGGSVTIGYVTVTKNSVSGKSGLKKAEIPMSDIGGADYTGGFVRILQKDMQHTAVNPIACHLDNAVCLIPIIKALVADQGGAQ